MDYSDIRRGAVLTSCMIMPGVQAKGHLSNIVMPCNSGLNPNENAAIASLGINPEKAFIERLGTRGSQRTFTRVIQHNRAVMLIHYNPDRLENTLYTSHAQFLSSLGIRVPNVLYDNPEQCISIFEDIGQHSLQEAIDAIKMSYMTKKSFKSCISGAAQPPARRAPATGSSRLHYHDEKLKPAPSYWPFIIKLYKKVLDQILVLHQEGYRQAQKKHIPLMPPFDNVLYIWEHQYFADYMLRQHLHMPTRQIQPIVKELSDIPRQLSRTPMALIHRDLQSSNIYVLKRRHPVFIDFQGMRPGAAAYDIASLLCDPYVCLPQQYKEQLLNYYLAHHDTLFTHDTFRLAAIQRLVQALGAYARLSTEYNMVSFTRYIQPGFRELDQILEQVEGFKHLKKLTKEKVFA